MHCTCLEVPIIHPSLGRAACEDVVRVPVSHTGSHLLECHPFKVLCHEQGNLWPCLVHPPLGIDLILLLWAEQGCCQGQCQNDVFCRVQVLIVFGPLLCPFAMIVYDLTNSKLQWGNLTDAWHKGHLHPLVHIMHITTVSTVLDVLAQVLPVVIGAAFLHSLHCFLLFLMHQCFLVRGFFLKLGQGLSFSLSGGFQFREVGFKPVLVPSVLSSM